MPYRTCDHLMEDGVYCSSPALRDQRYCYFHLNARARRVQAAQARLHGDKRRFQMPVLDNMHAVQAGIQQVIDALADDRIDNRRAGLRAFDDAVSADDGRARHFGIADAKEEDVGIGGDFLGRRAEAPLFIGGEFTGFVRVVRPERDGVSGAEKVAGHGVSHQAESEKSEVCHKEGL